MIEKSNYNYHIFQVSHIPYLLICSKLDGCLWCNFQHVYPISSPQ